MRYGEAPVSLGRFDPAWDEFMHYLYLPVRLPAYETNHRDPRNGTDVRLPERLAFLEPAVHRAMQDAYYADGHLLDPYVYVTARRGYAAPGNPLNRPGWHCDDFGGQDLNYIWSDRWPTRFLLSGAPLDLPTDDAASMVAMQEYADLAGTTRTIGGVPIESGIKIADGPTGELLRLTPYVVHDTPEIPAPGGMRSFFKISVSTHRYNLLGNSHNYLLDYDWPMLDRASVRNQPQGNSDYAVSPS